MENFKEDQKLGKFAKFNEALIGVIQDYSLVSFSKLHVEVLKTIYSLKLYLLTVNVILSHCFLKHFEGLCNPIIKKIVFYPEQS